LKVLFLMNCFKGQAAGECYYQLARELVRAGCEVTVLLPQDQDTPASEDMDGIKVKRFSYFWPQRLSGVAYGLGIPENLKASRLARLQLPFFLLAFLMRGLDLAQRADVVHVITTSPGPVGVLARLFWGKPFILTVIGSDVRLGPRLFNRHLLRFAHRVISATREQDEILAGLGRNHGLCDIKHLIDFSRFTIDDQLRREVREEFGFRPDDFVVTFVGRLYGFKDPMTFIRAAALVREREHRARFLLVGHGEQSAQAESLVRELGLEDVLIMTGHRDDIHRILAATDLFCTLSPVENCFAATILEAMTARKPVILTNAGYTSEAFPHLKYAYLIKPRDPVALALGVIEIMENQALRESLEEAGPECLKALGFDRQGVIERTMGLYREVMAETARYRRPWSRWPAKAPARPVRETPME
jgi:glycosyltransferase involved in cell wall biosynthesis